MSNKLKGETSPYLLQHADNPVNWYPWCDEAFEKAKAEDKPIFLSIGYSTCHWCHVMAHESFESVETAEILNKHFVSIKVDREERPDIDSVYMSVCQAFTGSGGWPMSIFMTWDKKPFFAGTYFPVNSRYGMPGFADLLNVISEQWRNNRTVLLKSADNIIAQLKSASADNVSTPSEKLTENVVKFFERSFDSVHGGFGSPPKFPTPHNLLFLMLYSRRNNHANALAMAEKTLLQMRKGGIFDHIGCGFSRYSTDKYYLAPHFEKMLYDNALLIMAYSAAYSLTNNALYLETAEKTAEYVLREMTSREGGFYSAQDADSDGVEGKYYTFSYDEIIGVLGDEKGRRFAQVFDITPHGNFEGVNIPNLLKSGDLTSNYKNELQKLYDYRKNRAPLHLDDKILVSWNSLMAAALSVLYRVSHNEIYLQAAEKAQAFIENHLCSGVQLYTSYRDGKRSEKGFLDDYAFYIAALIELYNSTLEKGYLDKAEQFCEEAVKRFYDNKSGGFYLCEAHSSELFMNPKETYDGALPSGNSVMAYDLVRLYQLTEGERYNDLAGKQLAFMSAHAQEYPAGYSMFLTAKLIYDAPPQHITVVTKDNTELTELKKRLPLLANISVVSESKNYPLINGRTTYYVCRNNNCLPPSNVLEL
ncbi:MAG: thioredoxin domain-containing protein [Oscillospiraceae bacterium]|nr:thioredoxin domain-containing protein [Oscillospiraceae bacterium]